MTNRPVRENFKKQSLTSARPDTLIESVAYLYVFIFFYKIPNIFQLWSTVFFFYAFPSYALCYYPLKNYFLVIISEAKNLTFCAMRFFGPAGLRMTKPS